MFRAGGKSLKKSNYQTLSIRIVCRCEPLRLHEIINERQVLNANFENYDLKYEYNLLSMFIKTMLHFLTV